MQDLRVTLIQSTLYWEDKEKNLRSFEDKIRDISEETDLIVLPEMFNTGFSMEPEKLYDEMGGETIQWMTKIALEKKCVVTGSLIIKEDDKFYNRLIWMKPDGNFETYDKRHLFSLAKEERIFASGEEKLIVELNGWRICPQICYDLRFPIWSRNSYNEDTDGFDYDCLLYIANWPEKRSYAWKQLLIARAIENQVYLLGVNRVGKDGNEIQHSGDTSFVDFKGDVLWIKEYSEEVKTVTLSAEELIKFRRIFQFYKDADNFICNK